MPDPIVKQIRDYLVQAVSNVKTANGYSSNLAGTLPGQLAGPVADGTVIVDFGADTLTEDLMGNDLEEHVQEFLLTVFVMRPEGTVTDWDDLRITYGADVRKAINEDVTCGNLAHDTLPGGVEVFKRADGAHEGITATAFVRYRTKFGDPFTVR